MNLFAVSLLISLRLCFSALSIDRYKIDTNRTVLEVDFKYINNEKGMAIMNVSVQTFHTITKAVVYFKANSVIRKDGRDYTQEFMKSRIDAAKLLNGLHGNFIVKSVMNNFLGDLRALNITIPLQKVKTILVLQKHLLKFLTRTPTNSTTLRSETLTGYRCRTTRKEAWK